MQKHIGPQSWRTSHTSGSSSLLPKMNPETLCSDHRSPNTKNYRQINWGETLVSPFPEPFQRLKSSLKERQLERFFQTIHCQPEVAFTSKGFVAWTWVVAEVVAKPRIWILPLGNHLIPPVHHPPRLQAQTRQKPRRCPGKWYIHKHKQAHQITKVHHTTCLYERAYMTQVCIWLRCGVFLGWLNRCTPHTVHDGRQKRRDCRSMCSIFPLSCLFTWSCWSLTGRNMKHMKEPSQITGGEESFPKEHLTPGGSKSWLRQTTAWTSSVFCRLLSISTQSKPLIASSLLALEVASLQVTQGPFPFTASRREHKIKKCITCLQRVIQYHMFLNCMASDHKNERFLLDKRCVNQHLWAEFQLPQAVSTKH